MRQRVGPVLQEVRAGGLATAEGISYLEAKHILLLQYCTHIVFYIMLKAEGRPVKDHPVISRCVGFVTGIYVSSLSPQTNVVLNTQEKFPGWRCGM